MHDNLMSVFVFTFRKPFKTTLCAHYSVICLIQAVSIADIGLTPVDSLSGRDGLSSSTPFMRVRYCAAFHSHTLTLRHDVHDYAGFNCDHAIVVSMMFMEADCLRHPGW